MRDKEKNSVDEGGQLDNLFRTGLDSFRVEPPPSLWNGISRKLLWRELLRFNFSNVSVGWWAGGILLLTTIIAVTYLNINDNETVADMASAPAAIYTPDQSSPINTGSTSTSLSAGTTGKGTPSEPMPLIKTRSTASSDPTSPVAEASVAPVSDEAEITTIRENASQPLDGPVTAVVSTAPAITPLNPIGMTPEIILPGTDTLTIVTPERILLINRDNINPAPFFAAGFGITPEATYYSGPENYSKVNFSVNGSLTYNISRFSVSLLPGITYTSDEGSYRVTYKSHDSIGFFNRVVSYVVDPVTNQITYNTETVSIYDSVIHSADDRTLNRYTYINIPLLFGYRLFESTRFSLSVRLGPAVSMLVASREAEPVIDYPNSTIIRVENTTPARVQTNWQMWVDLSLEYRVTPAISLYVAPVYKYYFSPIVEKENIQYGKPWSLGVGVGLHYSFGPKRNKP